MSTEDRSSSAKFRSWAATAGQLFLFQFSEAFLSSDCCLVYDVATDLGHKIGSGHSYHPDRKLVQRIQRAALE
jgi:hypothetical protein